MVRIEGGSASPRRTEPPKPPEPPKPKDILPDKRWAEDRFERTPSPQPLFTPTPTPLAAPTPPPPTARPSVAVYLGGLPEAELAALQQNQGDSIDCAEYAIAESLNLLYGGSVRGSEVATAANQITAVDDNRLGLPLPVPSWGLQWWENGPVTPWQQANIVNGIARQGGLELSANVTHPPADELIRLLGQPGTAVIVTLGWNREHVPEIARTSGPSQAFYDPGFWSLPLGVEVPAMGAHAMLLAAYDPTHVDQSDHPAPWGFVNSWDDGGTEIYWMSDEDFRQAYGFWPVGNALVITRESASVEATTPNPAPTPTSTPDLDGR